MERHYLMRGLILLLMALTLVSACEGPGAYPVYPVSPTYYYVSPTQTYLRECPSYDCAIVADVFSGDRVVVLNRNDFGWARAQLDRSGVIGWIPGDLLSLAPLPATYYVAASTVYLRECADHNCRALELLHRGDRVEKQDQDYRGWWRVMSFKSRMVGWVPAYSVSVRPGPPYYYVAVNGLAFRSGPSTSSPMITSLGLNRQVEMLNPGPGAWVQVREVRSGTIGWVYGSYLESFPVPYAKPVPKKKRAPAKKSAPEEAAPKAGPKAM